MEKTLCTECKKEIEENEAILNPDDEAFCENCAHDLEARALSRQDEAFSRLASKGLSNSKGRP